MKCDVCGMFFEELLTAVIDDQKKIVCYGCCPKDQRPQYKPEEVSAA